VDDEPAVRRAVSRMVGRLGFEVEPASSGLEALSLLKTGPVPAFVLMDITMPGLTGIETLIQIRVTHPELPVFIMSGRLPEEPITAANGTLQKPLTTGTLRTALAEVIPES
jgi:CheY-like chemotaxis protein